MKNYSVSFDFMLIFKFKRPQNSLLGGSSCRLLIQEVGSSPQPSWPALRSQALHPEPWMVPGGSATGHLIMLGPPALLGVQTQPPNP